MRMGSARDYRLRVRVIGVCGDVGAEGVRAGPFAHPTLSGRCTSRRPASRAGEGDGQKARAEVSPGPAPEGRSLRGDLSAQFAPLGMERASRPVICQATTAQALHVAQSRVGSTLPPHPRKAAGGAGSGSSHRQRGTTVADRWPLSKLLQASVSLPCRQVRCRASPFTLGLAGDGLGV